MLLIPSCLQVVQLAQLVHAMQQQAAASEASSTAALASMAQQLRTVATQQEQQQQQHQASLEAFGSRCAGLGGQQLTVKLCCGAPSGGQTAQRVITREQLGKYITCSLCK